MTAPNVFLVAAASLGVVVATVAAETVTLTATGNATTDTAAINNALAAAGDGDVFEFNGAFSINNVLNAQDNSNVTLSGLNGASLNYVGTTLADAILSVNGATNLTVTGLTFNGQNNANLKNGITASSRSGNNVTFDNITVRDIGRADGGFEGFGIFLDKSNNTTVRNSTFTNLGADTDFGAAINLQFGTGALVENNTITNTGRNGIYLKQTPNGLILNNTIRGTGLSRDEGLAIELFEGNDFSVIQGNTVDHWISVDKSSNIAIRNNVVDGLGSDRVQLAGLEIAGAGRNIVVVGNTVKQADGAAGNHLIGLSISNRGDKNQILIARNLIDAAEQYGMQLQGDDGDNNGEIRRIVVAQNTVTGTTRDGEFSTNIGDTNSEGTGVRMLNGVFDATFIDNFLTDNGGYGAAMGNIPGDVDEIAFADNTITGNNGNSADLVIDFGVSIGDTWDGTAVYFDGNTIDGGEPGVDKGSIQPLVVTVSLQEAIMAGEEVTLSLNLDDTQYQALWDMGDGLPLVGTTVTYTFTESETINVAIWDSNGVGGFVTLEITVIPEPVSTSAAVGLGLLALRRRR